MGKITIFTHGGEQFETDVKDYKPQEIAKLMEEHKPIAIGDVVLHSSTIAKIVPTNQIKG